MLEWIVEKYAEFGWTAALAVGWCLIIIIWALSAYYLGFRRKTKPLKVLVEKAKEKIKSIECSEAFVKGFEDFNAFATATPAIEPSWTEFKKALVYPHKDETQKIKSTVDSNYFFNFTTIVENNVDLRFYNEFPNYLTGTGILGTFVGLTIGIFLARAGLVSAEVELMRGALSNLLGGASLAFSTSLVGLFFSLIVSWKMKSWLYKIQVGIEEWCDILDAHLERVTIEGLTQENLSESKRQTVQLERFNTDLAISISSALDERLAGRFGPLLERSITALEGIKADRQEGQEKLLRDMVAEFKNTLSGAAGTEMTAIGDTLRELGHSMKETADRLTGAGNEAGEGFVAASKSAADEMRALIREVTSQMSETRRSNDEAMNQIMQRIEGQISNLASTVTMAAVKAGDNLQQAASGASSKIQGAATQVGESLISGAGELEKQIGKFGSSINSFSASVKDAENLATMSRQAFQDLHTTIDHIDTANRSLENAARPVEEVAKGMIASLEAQQVAFHGILGLTANLDKATSSLQEGSDQQRKAWVDLSDRFEGLDGALSKAFEEINVGVEAYTNQIRDFVRDLDTSLSSATQMLSGAIQELNAAVEELQAAKD